MKRRSESLTGRHILARRRFGDQAPLACAVFIAIIMLAAIALYCSKWE